MLRELALVILFSAALDATAALADAKQDCETLSGDEAIQACDQAIGDADIAAARAIQANIADEYAKHGTI